MQTIVVVDDNEVVGSIYRSKLRAEGFLAEVAVTGEAGLEMIRRVKPDLVLLDLMLPQIDGVEVLKTIRADAESCSVPVIVFSNSYDDSLVQEAWRAGATQVLSKSTHNPKQVVAAVNAALGAGVRPSTAASTAAVAAEPGRAIPATASPSAPVHARILYLAEPRDTRLMVSVLLEDAGHRVTAVTVAGDVIALAQSAAFDLFLIRDPETDNSALSLCRQLRALKPATQVAMFSVGANPLRREEGLRAGASTFLIDPADVLNVAAIVTKLIRQTT
ncbi:MAG: response regulator [Gemmatimonadaceae bacterium]